MDTRIIVARLPGETVVLRLSGEHDWLSQQRAHNPSSDTAAGQRQGKANDDSDCRRSHGIPSDGRDDGPQ